MTAVKIRLTRIDDRLAKYHGERQTETQLRRVDKQQKQHNPEQFLALRRRQILSTRCH